MPAPRLKRWTIRVVRGVILIYLVLLLVISLLQAKLIFPGALTQGLSSSIVPKLEGTDFAQVDTAEGAVAILFGTPISSGTQPSADPSTAPTILVFYGNGNCMADIIGLSLDLRRLGNNVVLVDYPGYGMSGCKPSETGVYAAAFAAYEYAIVRGHVDRTRIVPFGWSLGAAAATHLASHKPVAGLITLSPFTSMVDMARLTLPYFPTSLILKHRFENEKKFATLTCPIFIAHGSHDSFVPPTMSDRLAEVAGDKVRVNLRLDSDHNDLFEVGGDELIARIDGFVKEVSRNSDGKI